MGRPSTYTDAIGEIICDALRSGQSLRSICADEGMPSQSMVYRWIETNDDFRESYIRAREAQAEAMADEITDIADDGANDFMERQRKDGSTEIVVNQEHVQRSRLRIDARKWVAAKLLPKKYGDRVDHKHDVSISLEAWVLESLPAPEPQQARVIEGEARAIEGPKEPGDGE